MLLYLVRHGQTEDNARRQVGADDMSLSKKGIEGAHKLGLRLKQEKIEKLIASNQKRAVQTAEIIAKSIGLPMQTIPTIRERKPPTSLVGQPVNSPKVEAYTVALDEHADDPTWHYEDSENTADMITRVQTFLRDLESVTEERVCAVTHAGFLRYFAATLVLGDSVQPSIVRTIYRKFKHDNTAITLCEFTKEKGWKLITWNDQAHLGEPTPTNL